MKKVSETVYGKGAEEWAHKIARQYQDNNPWDTVITRKHDGGWAVFAEEPRG